MKKNIWLLVILIIGTILRFYHNTDISLWHDEAFSALLIKYNWTEMMYRIGLDVHPPAYYIFLRFWHYIFGDSLLSLRSFSVFFSVSVIWAVWLFTKTAFPENKKIPLVAALFIALNPFQIQYATEARMYTLGAFFTVLASYFLIRFLDLQKILNKSDVAKMNLPENLKNRKIIFWNLVGFFFSAVVMIYTHYYLLFAVFAMACYWFLYLIRHHKISYKEYAKFFGIWVMILLSYLPWVKIFIFQYSQVGAGYWIPQMDKWSIPSTLYTLIIGFTHDVNRSLTQKLLIFTAFFVLFVVWKFIRKTQSFHKWLVLFVTIAPFFGSLLFLILAKIKGSETSVYLVRYFIFTGAFLSIIVAGFIREARFKRLGTMVALSLIILNIGAFINYWKKIDIKNRPGMTGVIKHLKNNFEPTHRLYAGSSFVFFILKYYANQSLKFGEPLVFNYGQPSIRPLLYSGGNTDIKNMPHFAGTAILTNQDLLPDFNRDVKTGDIVWLVWTNGFGATKPEAPLNWKQVVEKEYPEVRPYLGANVYVSEYEVK